MPAPPVDFVARAFECASVLVGVICHGTWLLSTRPDLVRGRRVTCHNNLYGDVANMGAEYVDEDIVVDGRQVTARAGDHHHLFARTLIDQVAQGRV